MKFRNNIFVDGIDEGKMYESGIKYDLGWEINDNVLVRVVNKDIKCLVVSIDYEYLYSTDVVIFTKNYRLIHKI